MDGTSDEIKTTALETTAELLGKSDLQSAEAFGGQEDNWQRIERFIWAVFTR